MVVHVELDVGTGLVLDLHRVAVALDHGELQIVLVGGIGDRVDLICPHVDWGRMGETVIGLVIDSEIDKRSAFAKAGACHFDHCFPRGSRGFNLKFSYP